MFNTISQISGSATVAYSDIQGGWTGTGNIDLNPVFLSVPDDLHIVLGSPCIDTGDPFSAPPDFPADDISRQQVGYVTRNLRNRSVFC